MLVFICGCWDGVEKSVSMQHYNVALFVTGIKTT